MDDNPGDCAGAAALGLTAVQIIRGDMNGKLPTAGITVVRSLPQVDAML